MSLGNYFMIRGKMYSGSTSWEAVGMKHRVWKKKKNSKQTNKTMLIVNQLKACQCLHYTLTPFQDDINPGEQEKKRNVKLKKVIFP